VACSTRHSQSSPWRAPSSRRLRGVFVTGTDTGVGKTALSASLLAAMAAAGEYVRAHKPVVSGLEEQGPWPQDHELLASVAAGTPDEVAPLQYAPAVSPHLAAALAGRRPEPQRVLARAAAVLVRARDEDAVVVMEGAGGLLCPLSDELTVRDLAAALGLPLLIAARPGLGTINHTLLVIEAARAAGLRVVAVVLTPWPSRPSVMERSNRETIARLGAVEVATLAPIPGCDRGELARAGSALPWRRWLSCDPAHPGPAGVRHPSTSVRSARPARAAASTAAPTAARSSSSIT
jgi:dethiobiotin synthetase